MCGFVRSLLARSLRQHTFDISPITKPLIFRQSINSVHVKWYDTPWCTTVKIYWYCDAMRRTKFRISPQVVNYDLLPCLLSSGLLSAATIRICCFAYSPPQRLLCPYENEKRADGRWSCRDLLVR